MTQLNSEQLEYVQQNYKLSFHDKYELTKRINARADELFSLFKKEMQILQSDIFALHYVVSLDDYGGNLIEDNLVFIRVFNLIKNNYSNKFFCWSYLTDVDYWKTQRENNTKYSWAFCNHNSKTPIGQKSKSGNLRAGNILVLGVTRLSEAELLASYRKEN